MSESAHSVGSTPKEDAERLVLRGKPRPVVRFRRGLIVAVTGAVAAALVSLSWFALQAPASRKSATGAQSDEPESKDSADAVANLPRSYGDVPRLGPPLPGDLGRPILEHERGVSEPMPSTNVLDDSERARAAAEAESQRVAAAQLAARSSPVLVQLDGAGADARPALEEPKQIEELSGNAGSTPSSIPASQQRKIDFAQIGGKSDINPHELSAASSPWTLTAGTVIPASLITGLNSDLPGVVLAQITENVRDSATGRTILIPQGARLIGRYDSVLAFGQRRALLIWTRIVLPDGSSVQLDSMPATDTSGYAGLADKVDSHSWQLLKGIMLSTILGVGTQLSLGSGDSDLVRAIRESAQQNAANAGEQITARNLDIQPTIRVRPGWPVRAIVNKDIVLRPWAG